MKPAIENAVTALAISFAKNGCYRGPDQKRRKREGQAYKKGYEIRLTAANSAEVRRLRGLLREVGLSPGSPYRKSRGFILPVYGRQAVERFFDMIRSGGGEAGIRLRAAPRS